MTYKTTEDGVMSCSESTAKALKNELTISVIAPCGPNLP